MMLLTETKEYLMPMKVTVFPFKKVVAMVLLMILLTKVMVYVMAMHMTEDRTDQRNLRMQTMEVKVLSTPMMKRKSQMRSLMRNMTTNPETDCSRT